MAHNAFVMWTALVLHRLGQCRLKQVQRGTNPRMSGTQSIIYGASSVTTVVLCERHCV